jgi:hypothetical protein
MRRRLAALALPIAGVAALLALAPAALSATTALHGSLTNGGCGPVQPVSVSGPSHIDVSLSTTESSGLLYWNVLDPSGHVVANSRAYDTTGGGTYGVQVCSYTDSENQPVFTYNGLVGTGPAGKPALPRPTVSAVPTTTTASGAVATAKANGLAAIRSHGGLAWFMVHAPVDAAKHVNMSSSVGLKATFGTHGVVISGNGMTLTITKSGARQHVVFHSRTFNASGNVVRGSFTIA